MRLLVSIFAALLFGFSTQAWAGYCIVGQCQCTQFLWDNGYSDFKGAGNAYQWWAAARNKGHGQGSQPLVGAILVWQKNVLPYGHVALVTTVNVDGDGRKIKVNHANWPEDGNVRTGVLITDVSTDNDWTRVKVGSEGSAHNTYGFIYPVCKRSDGSCTLKRNGEVAWYPAISNCKNASQWFYVEAQDPIIFKIGPAAAILCDRQSQSCPAN